MNTLPVVLDNAVRRQRMGCLTYNTRSRKTLVFLHPRSGQSIICSDSDGEEDGDNVHSIAILQKDLPRVSTAAIGQSYNFIDKADGAS